MPLRDSWAKRRGAVCFRAAAMLSPAVRCLAECLTEYLAAQAHSVL
ncbi:MAG: hypothetical protein HHJ09_14870 [Glaciimonas sp.]|nr:hypothetical protein [Glaciimonas sp.]